MMKKTFSKIISIVTGVIATLSPLFNQIAVHAYDGAIIHTDKEGEESIIEVLKLVARIFTVGVGILGVIGIVISGIQYLTAGGNEEKTRKAKRRILEIVIGLAVYVVLYSLLYFLLPGFNGIEPS